MKSKYKLSICALVLILLLGLGVSTIPQAPEPQSQDTVTFALSSWDYPDEYGQGLEGIELFENTTGIWVQIGGLVSAGDSGNIELNSSYIGYSIKLRCYSYINSTLLGLSDTDEGKLVQRHNITVISLDETIFAQQNITWFYDDDSIDPPLWFYGYEVVLNFLLTGGGTIYTVTITYEVYY